jgi:hypothetical protein
MRVYFVLIVSEHKYIHAVQPIVYTVSAIIICNIRWEKSRKERERERERERTTCWALVMARLVERRPNGLIHKHSFFSFTTGITAHPSQRMSGHNLHVIFALACEAFHLLSLSLPLYCTYICTSSTSVPTICRPAHRFLLLFLFGFSFRFLIVQHALHGERERERENGRLF